jgi:hypothetical protein
VARALRPIVVEVNWEGCPHRDRCNSLLPNCMVLAEKVSEQVVTMTALEMIVEAPGGLSKIHHSRYPKIVHSGLDARCASFTC